MGIGLRYLPATFALTCLAAASASAQTSVLAQVGFNSQFVWRGVTSTNRFVLQPDVAVSTTLGGSSLSLGVWGNIEPRRYDGARDLSSLGGLPGPLLTQSEIYAEASRSIGPVEAAVGAEAFLFPHVGELAEYTTVEGYVSASVDASVAASIKASYDVGPIRGAYVEGAVSRTVTGDRYGALTLGATAGYSAGQATDPRGRDLAYFDRDGLTHVDASASATFTRGRVAIAPEAHVIFAYDALATVTEPDVSRRAKLWFGTTLSWASDRGR